MQPASGTTFWIWILNGSQPSASESEKTSNDGKAARRQMKLLFEHFRCWLIFRCLLIKYINMQWEENI